MKIRIVRIAVLVVFLAAGAFGVIKRQVYTDIASENDYMDKLKVALLREKSVASCCNAFAEELPNLPIILKVKCMDEIEHVFGAGQQKVHVEQIFKGSELVEEEEFYVYSERWDLSLSVLPDSVERGFVNIMEPGEEYLVFLSGKRVKVYGKDATGYEVFSDMLILPVFLYGNRDHTPMELSENVENTYVSYSVVKGNEIFSDTEAGYAAWLELKEMLFERYADG